VVGGGDIVGNWEVLRRPRNQAIVLRKFLKKLKRTVSFWQNVAKQGLSGVSEFRQGKSKSVQKFQNLSNFANLPALLRGYPPASPVLSRSSVDYAHFPFSLLSLSNCHIINAKHITASSHFRFTPPVHDTAAEFRCH
jgi:hypothetical protein